MHTSGEYVNPQVQTRFARTQAGAQTRDTGDRSAINHGGLRYRLAGSTRRQTAAIWLTLLAACVLVEIDRDETTRLHPGSTHQDPSNRQPARVTSIFL